MNPIATPSSNAKHIAEQARIDNKVRLASQLTVSYVFAIGIYVLIQNGPVFAMKPNEFGDFLAGVAAPLAFGWLIFGYALQRDQLKMQSEQLVAQMDELQLQRAELSANTKANIDQAAQQSEQVNLMSRQLVLSETQAANSHKPLMEMQADRRRQTTIALIERMSSILTTARDAMNERDLHQSGFVPRHQAIRQTCESALELNDPSKRWARVEASIKPNRVFDISGASHCLDALAETYDKALADEKQLIVALVRSAVDKTLFWPLVVSSAYVLRRDFGARARVDALLERLDLWDGYSKLRVSEFVSSHESAS